MKKLYQIPKCPECKAELKTVYENVYETYVFDEKKGTYKEETFTGELEVKCIYCGVDLSELFEEGACNYQAKRTREDKFEEYTNCVYFRKCALKQNGRCPKDCIDYDD